MSQPTLALLKIQLKEAMKKGKTEKLRVRVIKSILNDHLLAEKAAYIAPPHPLPPSAVSEASTKIQSSKPVSATDTNNSTFQSSSTSNSIPTLSTSATDNAQPSKLAISISQLIQRGIKRRQDSIKQFEQGGREDLASGEKAELDILQSFLPPPLPLDQIQVIIKETIQEHPGQSFGGLMSTLTSPGGRLEFCTDKAVIVKELKGLLGGAGGASGKKKKTE